MRRSKAAVTVDKEFYVGLLDRISDGVYFVTRDRRITYWNAGAERITGYTAEEVVGHSCSEGILRHVSPGGRQLCLHGCPLAGVMRDGKDRTAHVYLHHKDGQRVPVTVRGQAIRDESGAIIGSVEVFSTRVSSSYVDSRRVPTDDSLDPVSELPLRRFGELHLQTLLTAAAERSSSFGVLFIDADHFKRINDAFGHVMGDHVLRMVGQSLANGLRRGDVPIRWGGEEFVALLPGADAAGIESTAERVRMLIENSWIQEGEDQARVTVSIGATLALAGDTPESILDRADRLMYASKESGRNRVTSDRGEQPVRGEAPIPGRSIPWEMPDLIDLDGFGSGEEPGPQVTLDSPAQVETGRQPVRRPVR